jgi:glutamine synthetase
MEPYSDFGIHVFKGTVADEYLKKHGLDASVMKDPSWTKTHADTVAAAVLDWAIDNGANTYCHWFQPMAANGVRHGLSGQVQNMMLKFDSKTNKPAWDFDGKTLIKGETDGSSYPNGGLRGTHCAGGYLAVDTSSDIWLRGDTIFIPSAFVSYYGAALDEKTPLLRSNEALSKHAKRLLKCLGYEFEGPVIASIGLEQEIFLVPRDAYYKRPDLQLTGRTVLGRFPARGQEMSDHYMAPLSSSTAALACMQEIQEECWRIGIPLKTRHREVAPNQFEFAPMFGFNTIQIDQNIIVMQLIEEIAGRHGLAALLQEKPFEGVNGSGKHNNWSLWTATGANLMNPTSINTATGNPLALPVIMAAILAAVDEYGDLMRMSIATPGNDFRLGACEAPPAIVSTYLGESMTSYLEAFIHGDKAAYNPQAKTIDLGTPYVLPFTVPAEDRNRTSPFPYGGGRFEFRAVGSSQNVSLVNTVLNTITAAKFDEFATAVENGADPVFYAQQALKDHWRVVFNGNNYDPAMQQMLTDKGVWRIDSGVEAVQRFIDPKNVALFEKMGVFQANECAARTDILHGHYIGTVEMECMCMINMIQQHIIPSCKNGGVGPIAGLEKVVLILKEGLANIHHAETPYEKAKLSRVLRLETMIDARSVCDDAEEVCPANLWTLATYMELLFLDSHSEAAPTSHYE